MERLEKKTASLIWFWLALLICVSYYITILALNQVPQDEGDGLQHFNFSQISWKDHAFFLNHWGKPFFILFSSAFAQLGFDGYICFNILVFASSCFVARAIMNQYNTPQLLQILFPFILISIPDYSNAVIGGMTEPFFGLLLLLLYWLAIKERFLWFVILCSFTPFARSEGMLVVVLAVPYLLLLKQWKYIPFLGLGFVVYAIFGWILIDQPLWYFENNPYSPISIYGSGPWNSYLLSSLEHLGLISIVLLPFAIFGWFVWKSQSKRTDRLHALFFTGLYLGIIVIHSYLWAKGLRGALGLSRLATLGLLPFLTILFIALGYVFRELHKLTHAFVAIVILLLVGKALNEATLPTIASPQQISLKKAAIYLEQHQQEVNKIYYFHPLLIYFQHSKTNRDSKQYIHRFIHLDYDVANTFKTGDLIVRDSKFGPIEQGIQLDDMRKYPWIIPVKQFYTTDMISELNGEQKSVIIYQVMDKKSFNRQQWDNKQETFIKKDNFKFKTPGTINDLYYIIDTVFQVPALYGPKQDLEVKFKLKTTGSEPVYLIFDNQKGYYLSIPLTEETTKASLSFLAGNIKGLLFVHNPSLEPYELVLETESWKQSLDSGLQPIK